MKSRQESELIQNSGGEAEMEMSDNDDDVQFICDSSNSASKRRRVNKEATPTSQTTESMMSMAAGWMDSNMIEFIKSDFGSFQSVDYSPICEILDILALNIASLVIH